MTESPSQESNAGSGSVGNLSDENKAWLVICACIFLLLSFSVGVAALVLVLQINSEILRQTEEFDKINTTFHEFVEEYDERWENVSTFAKESKNSDEDFSDKLLSLYRDSGIHVDYNYGSTWTSANQFCTIRRYRLCSYKDIFPKEGQLFKEINGLGDEEWVPVSDSYNDWAQVGKRTNRKQTYIEQNGQTPIWGEAAGSESLKRRVFCCLDAFKDKED